MTRRACANCGRTGRLIIGQRPPDPPFHPVYAPKFPSPIFGPCPECDGTGYHYDDETADEQLARFRNQRPNQNKVKA